jgi:hypothetical protein
METTDFYKKLVMTLEGKASKDINGNLLSYADVCKSALLNSPAAHNAVGRKAELWNMAQAIHKETFKFDELTEDQVKTLTACLESMCSVAIAGQIINVLKPTK